MLEIKDYALPSPDQWRVVIKGMRLPFKSGDKSDSQIETIVSDCFDHHHEIFDINRNETEDRWIDELEKLVAATTDEGFVLGKKDANLLKSLTKLGSSDRKILRALDVDLIIKAPLYWWKQMDQYKVGTVTSSESTMHTIMKEKFSVYDFSISGLDESNNDEIEVSFEQEIVDSLNVLRKAYLEHRDPKVWLKIIEILPESYNQTRLWHGSYENLLTIFFQRDGHKLPEWDIFRNWCLENVSYFKELVEAIKQAE